MAVDRIAAFRAEDCFSVRLVPLAEEADGSTAPSLLVPEPELGRRPVGLTRQFLEDAPVYASRYTATEYFAALIRNALERCGIELVAPLVLDIGSGSGNSVLPCLELFPDCRIVATDLSPDLLRILGRHIAALGAGDRVALVCVDATRDLYRAERFDLVIGAAILHHLIDPEAAIRGALRALRPGGRAIFFEPFEAGNAVLRLAYEEILREAERGARLDARVRRLLVALVEDFRVRAGSDKSAPLYAQIDDKWLFTRSHLEEMAARGGARAVLSYPLHDVASPFTHQTVTNLRLGAELPRDALAPWAWAILHRYDTAFSTEQKRDLPIEGAIVLTK